MVWLRLECLVVHLVFFIFGGGAAYILMHRVDGRSMRPLERRKYARGEEKEEERAGRARR